MTRSSSLLLTAGFLAALTLLATAANAPKLKFTFHEVAIPGAQQTYVYGVNNAGVIVGSYQDSSGAYQAFLLNGRKLTKFKVPHGTNVSLGKTSPNKPMQIVGSYQNSAGSYIGFLYKNGHYRDIPGPNGAANSFVNGINDEGEMVGSFNYPGGIYEGFVLTKSGYTIFNVNMSKDNAGTGINDKGKVVYWSVDGLTGATTSYLYDIKTQQSTQIDVPGGTDSLAQDINNEGDIAYQWLDGAGASHGALFHLGKFYKFDYPKSIWDYASGLNDKNMLVGSFEAVTGGPFAGFKASY